MLNFEGKPCVKLMRQRFLINTIFVHVSSFPLPLLSKEIKGLFLVAFF